MKETKPSIKKKSTIKKTTIKENFTVVAIGASAGGLEAISEFLRNISSTTGMAYIYVQHLSPDHKSLLSSLLSKETEMKVQEVEDMEKMEPNNVYIIPYNKELVVTNGHIKLIPRPKNKPTNLSIDVLFSSLALTHKENVIGIVLSGNGQDGTRGLIEIKLAGGITFAQDESAKFSSMPKSAISEGVVDFILSPKKIASEIMSLGNHKIVKSNPSQIPLEDEIENSDPNLTLLLQVLRKNKNVDFSYYKMNTFKRRVLRRMLINKIKTIKQYATFTIKNKTETDQLYKDLLINVTDFFRDSNAFTALKKTVIPSLIKSKKSGEPIRIWVAACATGEEVYSIAMLVYELLDNKINKVPFQIFASDLSEEAIKKARNGEYTSLQLKNVSDKRLQRFFTKSKDKYRISQSMRDVCIFAQHNILSDPPFSKMDFISCRNFLIYLEPPAQKKAISTFHYALKEGGYMMLGKSETIGNSAQLFTCLNKTYKIYARKKNSGTSKISDLVPRILNSRINNKSNVSPQFSKKITPPVIGNLSNAFDSVLLSQFIPASVIINYDMEILQFRGPTSSYLMQSAGKASFNILKMVNNEITFELRNTIHHAIKLKQTVRKTRIEMKRDVDHNTMEIVNIEVIPITVDGEEPLLLVIFTGQQTELSELPTKGKNKSNSSIKDRRIKKLEEELASARYDMGSITHDQELANEELQSANEEIVSSNEELQSLNEELETSKEEIESTNEELITTNQELYARIQQVEELYSYYEGILSTIHEPMLILDKNMRVKSANKAFYKTFHVGEEESIGVSLFKMGDSQWNIPKLRELLEEIVPKNNHFHDFEVEFTFPVIGKKTMLLNAHRIIQKTKKEESIVLTISDITEVKRLAVEMQLNETKALEIELDYEKKLLREIELINNKLIEAKTDADRKRQIAENAVLAKQEFLSKMSHEIRTPMNSIVGFTRVLLKTNLGEKQKEYLNAIKISSEALTLLTNDILDIAKVEAGKMTFENRSFKMCESISSMLHLFDLKIKENNVTFIKEYDNRIPILLLGDSARLHQIILNLLSNAVKFTTKGEIRVSVKLLEENDKKVKIEFVVADTGIGISEKDLNYIFDDFQQASSGTSRIYGGTGLGLAIVKQLVETQGGNINVKSKLGEGSTFSFSLDFEKTTTETEEESTTEIQDKTNISIKVLIVEDVLLNQLLIKTLLDDFGFKYDFADNGKIGIEKLKQSTFDIILMDLQMPLFNGFEATEYIRNTMHLSIPIIALTADITTVDFEKCKSFGMDDYISKPIDEKILYSKIVSLVEKSKLNNN